jgi:hypothetical protein
MPVLHCAALAEAFARGSGHLGWVNVHVGDPLMKLDRKAAAGPADLDGDDVAWASAVLFLKPGPSGLAPYPGSGADLQSSAPRYFQSDVARAGSARSASSLMDSPA